MEETMSSFYNHSSVRFPPCKAVVGQLVAVREEDGDEITRAQVVELISPDKVKVRMFRCLYPQMILWLLGVIVKSGVSGGGIGFLIRCLEG